MSKHISEEKRISYFWLSLGLYFLVAVTGAMVTLLPNDVNSSEDTLFSGTRESRNHDSTETISVTEAKGEMFLNVEDFIISVKDDHQKERVIIFNVALAVDSEKTINNEALRRMIYKTTKMTGRNLSVPVKVKDCLRNEIRRGLNHLMGSDAIKGIYFTKFVLL